MALSPDKARLLVDFLRCTKDEEMPCDECLRLLSEYVDAEKAGADLSGILEQVRVHLGFCPCCMEECDALRRALA